MANGQGGARKNAGRPKGAIAQKNQEVIERAKEGGLMPLDVLLNDMRFFYSQGEQILTAWRNAPPLSSETESIAKEEIKSALEHKKIARDCAAMAAPYLHPKLMSTDANVRVTNVEAELAELE